MRERRRVGRTSRRGAGITAERLGGTAATLRTPAADRRDCDNSSQNMGYRRINSQRRLASRQTALPRLSTIVVALQQILRLGSAFTLGTSKDPRAVFMA